MRWAATLFTLCFCLASGALAYNAWQAWQLRQPGFHEQDCWFQTGITGPARCGLFTVRENRQNPESRTIRLPVVIFEATKPEDGKEPILYLTGGPGGSAYLGKQHHVNGWWSERRLFPQSHDLIVMGQRGTGLQQLSFDCPELRGLRVNYEARLRGEDQPDGRALAMAGARACAERLQNEGVDLTAYNSRETAFDIAELRLALDIENWTLYGVSYGSRLALSVLRYRPEGVRAVILDSVFPPEASWNLDSASGLWRALQIVFAECSKNPRCVRQYGDLADLYPKAIRKLRQEATSVSLREIFGDRERVFEVDGRPLRYSPKQLSKAEEMVFSVDDRRFNSLLINALATPKGRHLIPALIREAAEGRMPVLLAHLRDHMLGSSQADLSVAVKLSHICRDEIPFDDPEARARAIAEAGDLAYMIEDSRDADLCQVWPAGKAEPIESTPVTSTVPALLLAGSYDPQTPPSLARSAASHLPNGHFYELDDAGHGVLAASLCAEHLMNVFLEDLAPPPASACIPEGRLELLYR